MLDIEYLTARIITFALNNNIASSEEELLVQM